MNVHELPMILFTVISQMSVGAFLMLGLLQVLGRRKYSGATIDRLADPALLAIGPALVFGLAVSMFHMNDVTNTLNVIRHVGSSWLSREIAFGMAFAGLGFVFALLQWRKIGPPALRQVLALLTALAGIGLVWSQAMIYYTLVTVPAWNSWFTIVQFFATTVLLGALAVGAAFMGWIMWNRRAGKQLPGKERAELVSLTEDSLKAVSVIAIVAGSVLLVVTPVFLSQLSGLGAVGAASAAAYSGVWFVVRLVLLAFGTALLALFMYYYASSAQRLGPRPLAVVATVAFVVVLGSELIGRSMFYDSMTRIGM
ncbi:MAG: dimethyl sulfoxide reductase anchor subunit [Actinomycetales bacterium]|nr:dimethyl sulfoxide reductase anchor subunit [Actinomycetales bacterium]